MVELPNGEKNSEYMYNRLDTISSYDGQKDGRTDTRTDILPRHSPRYAYASRRKKTNKKAKVKRRGKFNMDIIFYRATRMNSADYAVARCPYVCLSARLSHADIESKRLYISSTFLHRRVSPPF